MKLEDLFEAQIERKTVVRQGKVIRKKTCPDGFKLVNGACVRQTPEERRNRSRGATRGNRKNKASRERTRKRSNAIRRNRNL